MPGLSIWVGKQEVEVGFLNLPRRSVLLDAIEATGQVSLITDRSHIWGCRDCIFSWCKVGPWIAACEETLIYLKAHEDWSGVPPRDWEDDHTDRGVALDTLRYILAGLNSIPDKCFLLVDELMECLHENLDRPKGWRWPRRKSSAECETVLKRWLTLLEESEGPDHPVLTHALVRLAQFYTAEGRFSEAEPYWQRRLYNYQKHLGDDPDVLEVRKDLADCYRAQGRLVEAGALERGSQLCGRIRQPERNKRSG